MLRLLSVTLLLIGALADFGFVRKNGRISVDVDSEPNLVFGVAESNCDIKSFVFDGHELQDKSRGSHISSGLDSKLVTVDVEQDGDYVIVTCTTPTLTHYHVARRGSSDVYMATYISAEPKVGELRFIARLKGTVLTELWPHGRVSNTASSTGVVEGSDVFIVGNETRSKFYSSDRFIDDKWHCVAGSGMRACFIMPGAESYESSSGGPFFRDINSNNVGSATHLTFYMNSGHVQTETYRTGLFGPYVLSFRKTDAFPTEEETQIDTSFFDTLNIKGYIPQTARGQVEGRVYGTDPSMPAVVHWLNSAAQYWAVADASGQFISPYMKSGVYTQVLYQDELEVQRISEVRVQEGETTWQDASSAWPQLGQRSLFQIGLWDGKPTAFCNADKQLRMHPSDARMDSWDPVTFKVGQDDVSRFPMALFKAVNSPVTIEFELSQADIGDAKLRVGTTLAFQYGRPRVTVNGNTRPVPAAGRKIKSRGVTRGAYRGLGELYDFDLPAILLKEGLNSLVIETAAGSDGVTFLSPSFIFDAVQLWLV